jgi:hypothetical protein
LAEKKGRTKRTHKKERSCLYIIIIMNDETILSAGAAAAPLTRFLNKQSTL